MRGSREDTTRHTTGIAGRYVNLNPYKSVCHSTISTVTHGVITSHNTKQTNTRLLTMLKNRQSRIFKGMSSLVLKLTDTHILQLSPAEAKAVFKRGNFKLNSEQAVVHCSTFIPSKLINRLDINAQTDKCTNIQTYSMGTYSRYFTQPTYIIYNIDSYFTAGRITFPGIILATNTDFTVSTHFPKNCHTRRIENHRRAFIRMHNVTTDSNNWRAKYTDIYITRLTRYNQANIRTKLILFKVYMYDQYEE